MNKFLVLWVTFSIAACALDAPAEQHGVDWVTRDGTTIKALAVAAIVLALAGNARAESALLGRPNGAWFVGASAAYIRDGRVGRFGYDRHEGPAGWGYGLEAGRRLLPWLSISLIYRLANLSERFRTDPGSADFTERQHRLGPRIDLWPVPGRLRMGVAFVRSWRWSETAYSGSTLIGSKPEVLVRSSMDNTYELHLGVVPLRWHGFELELSGGFSREPSGRLSSEGRILSTFSVGFGLRWRTGVTPRPAVPPPTPSSLKKAASSLADLEERIKAQDDGEPTKYDLESARRLAGETKQVIVTIGEHTEPMVVADSYKPGRVRGTAFLYVVAERRIACVVDIDVENGPEVKIEYRTSQYDTSGLSSKYAAATAELARDLATRMNRAIATGMRAVR